jgi:hypothetical protein
MTRVAEAVSESIKAVGFGGLDAVEDARRRLAEAANRNAVTRRGSGDDRYEPQP